MLLHVEKVLNADELAHCRDRLARAEWADGRLTAGYQSAQAKHNQQLPEGDPVAGELGALVQGALARHATFFSAALPRGIYPPMFNRYEGGQKFGMHVDNAIRYDRSVHPPLAIRTDISATLFLGEPDEYNGGELVVEDTYGTHSVKLPAGDLVLYPGTSLHRVEPVTRGARVASFFWIQSMVRCDTRRRTLFELDTVIQDLTGKLADAPELIQLTGIYHNLLREWSDV